MIKKIFYTNLENFTSMVNTRLLVETSSFKSSDSFFKLGGLIPHTEREFPSNSTKVMSDAE